MRRGKRLYPRLYQDTLGGAVDTLNSYRWDPDQKLLANLLGLGGTFADATVELATGLLGLEGIKNTLAERQLIKAAEQNGISLQDQLQLETDLLTGKNLTGKLLGVEPTRERLAELEPERSGAMRAAGGLTEAAGSMAGAMAASYFAKDPNLGRYLMSLQAAGSKAGEALDSGAAVEDATRAGMTAGAVEYGLEGLFRGIRCWTERKGAR